MAASLAVMTMVILTQLPGRVREGRRLRRERQAWKARRRARAATAAG